MQTIKITWLSPEQPPDCQQGYAKSVIPDSEDAQRQAELIVKYCAELAEKDAEIAKRQAALQESQQIGLQRLEYIGELEKGIEAQRTIIADRDARIANLLGLIGTRTINQHVVVSAKDDEIATLRTALAQRHALIEQQQEKIAKLKDELSVTQTLYAKSRKESEDAASRANAPIPNDAIFMELWGKVSAAERGLNQALYFLGRRIDELAGIN